MLNQKSFLSFAALALVGSVALAADPAVKKSDSGICHEKKLYLLRQHQEIHRVQNSG